MKLIVEKVDGQVYVYREKEGHFRRVQSKRAKQLPQLQLPDLDNDCDLSHHDDFHLVVDLK